MSRSVVWQRSVSDAISWRQDQALNSTIFILREIGPTSFLLKEDGESKKFKVCLGDPHICNCTNFRKEQSLCKHICWVLLKKFKLERENELSYQLGLVEREINGLLKGPSGRRKIHAPVEKPTEQKDSNQVLEQRPIAESDVCPICQDELLAKHLPVTYCRHGCGNSVHIKCMKVWADHQHQSTGSNEIQCPFCRKEFASLSYLLKEFRTTLTEQRPRKMNDHLEAHQNTNCAVCQMSPIKGKCYKCSSCNDYHLCNTCYHGRNHLQHNFLFRVRKAQRWRPCPPRNDLGAGDLILSPVTSELQMREITENDYDTLLELDRPQNSTKIPVDLAGLPDHVISRLPLIKVRPGGRLLAPGRQCRLCLRAYAVSQLVRRLPECGHTFHRDCIDQWLREDHRCCPVDRQPVYDPNSTTIKSPEKPKSAVQAISAGQSSDLVVPGIGIVRISPLPHTSNRTAASLTQSAGTTRRMRYNSSERRRLMDSSAGLGPNSNNDITMGDILVQADVIGTMKSKTNNLQDSDVLHIRDNRPEGRPVPGHPNLQLAEAFNLNWQQQQKQEVKKQNKKGNRPTKKLRPKPGDTDVPLFPRNREETFSLSGTSIVKPREELEVCEENSYQYVPVENPSIYSNSGLRQYRHSYMPSAPMTSPEPIVHHEHPILQVDVIEENHEQDNINLEEETHIVLASNSVRDKGLKEKGHVYKGPVSKNGFSLKAHDVLHNVDGVAGTKLQPNFMVCHSAPTAFRRHHSPNN